MMPRCYHDDDEASQYRILMYTEVSKGLLRLIHYSIITISICINTTCRKSNMPPLFGN